MGSMRKKEGRREEKEGPGQVTMGIAGRREGLCYIARSTSCPFRAPPLYRKTGGLCDTHRVAPSRWVPSPLPHSPLATSPGSARTAVHHATSLILTSLPDRCPAMSILYSCSSQRYIFVQEISACGLLFGQPAKQHAARHPTTLLENIARKNRRATQIFYTARARAEGGHASVYSASPSIGRATGVAT